MANHPAPENSEEWDDEDEISLLDLFVTISENLKLLILGPLIVGIVTLAFSFLLTPMFTAKTSILPPNPSGNTANQLLDSLGSFAGVAGGALGISDPSQQYIAYIQSSNFEDLIIEKYDLQKRYEQKYIAGTREVLENYIQVTSDKKSGLISIEVSDIDPEFAALMANGLVSELRLFTGRLQLQEAQNRRAFLETQIKEITSRPFMDAMSQQMLIANLIRQYELARVDEGRVGPTFVQVDVATAPEFKSKPKRALMAIIATIATGFALLIFVFVRKALQNAETDPITKEQVWEIKSNLRSLWPPNRWIHRQKNRSTHDN
jgi:uncharacterized protein involved in exopolysaccharide biosynthesis